MIKKGFFMAENVNNNLEKNLYTTFKESSTESNTKKKIGTLTFKSSLITFGGSKLENEIVFQTAKKIEGSQSFFQKIEMFIAKERKIVVDSGTYLVKKNEYISKIGSDAIKKSKQNKTNTNEIHLEVLCIQNKINMESRINSYKSSVCVQSIKS